MNYGPCPMCSREYHSADLCEHGDPMCPDDCSLHHDQEREDAEAERFREWVREGWAS